MGIDVISSSANKGMQVYASTGQMLVQAQIAGLLAGELQSVNRMAGGAITAAADRTEAAVLLAERFAFRP